MDLSKKEVELEEGVKEQEKKDRELDKSIREDKAKLATARAMGLTVDELTAIEGSTKAKKQIERIKKKK